MEIVLGVFVGSALHGHHFSIQEVDHEKQMFADLLASVHELLAEYSTSELCLLGWPNDYSYTSEYCLAHWPYEYKYLWGE